MHLIVRATLTLTTICAAHIALAQQAPRHTPATLAGGAIYTVEQAKLGHDVYVKSCASCHGDKMQGLAAPALAGKDFLTTAQHNGLTIGMLQTIVTQNMPFNDPASLTDTQYADVIAYMLASNCFPSGNQKFPEQPKAAISKIKISTPDHPSGTPSDSGVCSVN